MTSARFWIRLSVLAVALVLGAWLRLRGISDLPLFGDEHHTLVLADMGYGEILTTFDMVGSHVPLALLQRLSLDIFGPGVVPFRLVAILPGLLFLLLAYPALRSLVGRDAAALATMALAVNPMVIYYARFARGYALALLLALVLVWALGRILDPEGRRARVWGVLIAAGALLPYVHLSTLGFVLVLGLAGSALAARETRALGLRLLGAFTLAGALAFVLFTPLLSQVVDYFRAMQPESAPLSWFGIPLLLAGGAAEAWVLMALLGAGAFLCWRERRTSVLLTAAALVGPLVLLLATNPRGLDYAWARYIMSALPCLVALCAAGLVGLGRLALGSGSMGLVLGALLCLVHYWTGPLGPGRAPDGSFSNTYLAMYSLPAFDQPQPGASAFYGALALDPSVERIIESPPIMTRSVLVWRNHALLHGKRVTLGWTGPAPRGIQGGPYRRLLEIEPGDADYLVLHRAPLAEVESYFEFVYTQSWPRIENSRDASFMLRQASMHAGNLPSVETSAAIADKLLERFGPMIYQDERILVWELR